MIRLLTYCVYKQKLDPMFQLLAKNFQLQPNGSRALVLYEEFVAPQAPLMLSLGRVEKSSDWQLSQTIDKIQTADRLLGLPINDTLEDGPVHVRHLPAKNSFDSLLRQVTDNSRQFTDIEESFDPELSAVKNLPGGQLSPAQRQFNEHVWKPSRNRLSIGGFFMIANIGG